MPITTESNIDLPEFEQFERTEIPNELTQMTENHGELPPTGLDLQSPPEPETEDIEEIPPELINEAAQYGLDQESIGKLSASQISSMLGAIDRRSVEMLSQQQPQQQFHPQQNQYPQQLPQQFPQQFPQHYPQQFHQQPLTPPGFLNNNPGMGMQFQPMQNPAGFPPMFNPAMQHNPFGIAPPPKVELNRENYDDGIISQFEKMNDYVSQMQQQFAYQQWQMQQQQLQQQMANQQPDDQYQDDQLVDLKIAGLGEYKEVFGEGSYNQLHNLSEQKINRDRLMDTYYALKSLHPNADMDSLFSRAMRAAFGHVMDQKKQQQLSDQVGKRKKQSLGRPTSSRNGTERKVLAPSGLTVDADREHEAEHQRILAKKY